MLACASADAHAYASPLQAENAHRGFAAVGVDRIKEVDALSADRAKEKSASAYDCTSRQTLGEQFDTGLGQYYLRARYMDPKAARFTQQDSFAGRARRPETLNKYDYANSNPILYCDPSGHEGLFSLSASIKVTAILLVTAVSAYAALEGGKRFDKRKDVYLDFSQMDIRYRDNAAVRAGVVGTLENALGPFGIKFHLTPQGMTSRRVTFGGSDEDALGKNWWLFSSVYTTDITKVADYDAFHDYHQALASTAQLGAAIGNIAAHEVGHSYGLHDNRIADGELPQYIMDTEAGISLNPLPWSPKDAGYLAEHFR